MSLGEGLCVLLSVPLAKPLKVSQANVYETFSRGSSKDNLYLHVFSKVFKICSSLFQNKLSLFPKYFAVKIILGEK